MAQVVAPDIGGVAAWVRLAQEEGLLPSGLDPQDPAIHANLPRIHAAFGPLVAGRIDRQRNGRGSTTGQT
ncbi:MAG: hypothetical protein ACREDF_05040 [Thermoplasmata archaeon]